MDDIYIRQILATNLRNWMQAADGKLSKQLGLSAKAGLAQTTVGRILNCQNSANIDVVDLIAKAFGRTAAELLEDPNLHKINYDRAAYQLLSEQERENIERYIVFVIAGSMQHKSTMRPDEHIAHPASVSSTRQLGITTLTFDTDQHDTPLSQQCSEDIPEQLQAKK